MSEFTTLACAVCGTAMPKPPEVEFIDPEDVKILCDKHSNRLDALTGGDA